MNYIKAVNLNLSSTVLNGIQGQSRTNQDRLNRVVYGHRLSLYTLTMFQEIVTQSVFLLEKLQIFKAI